MAGAAVRIAAVRAAAGLAAVAALAALAAAPARGQVVEAPVVVSSPASGDTYRPGERIVVQVRPGSNPVTSFLSAENPRITLQVGSSNKTLNGTLKNIPSFVSQRFYDYDTRSYRTATRGGVSGVNVLEFSYRVGSADRDADGVSIAADSLAGGSIGAQTQGFQGGFSYNPNLNKSHAAMSAQSGHKVGPEPPSFSGVSSPSLLLYTCGPFDNCGSASHRLPTIVNAAAAYNVRYSVTPALPSGLSVNSSTAVLSGSHSGWTTRRNYTLRATDGYNQTADLTFSLEVRDGAGVESIAVTSNPGSDRTYGKNGDFGTNDTITVRVDFNRNLGTIIRRYVCLNIRIGSNTRRACNPTGAARQDKLHFSYAVVESDWDGDGISFPANPMGAGKGGDLRFHSVGIGGGDNRVDRSFGAVPDDPNHKVRGRQTTPGFGSTASPSFSWVKDNAVSQALPAATGGDGGLTYSIEEGLPDGLVFAAATRTLSGTPTAVQGRTNYTLVATDGDGDKTELRFSIEIREIVLSISSPSVSEGAAGETAALPFAVTLNRAPGRQVTVDWAAAADPGTAASGADYTAFSGGTLTFSAADTSKTVEVTVTGDARDEPDETVRIALSNPSGAVVGSAATGVGTITDDDPTPTLTLALSDPDAGRPDTIRESGAGNATTVTASLGGGTSGEAITVTVSAASTYAALAADGGFALSAGRTLTIAAGQAASAGAVTIAATDDIIDSADKTATVSGAVAGGHGLVAAPADLTLTIADEDSRPSSALALAPASVSESGGVATVTATLSHPSAEAVTIAVSATASTGAVDGDFALSTANTLTVAAGRTASAGVVTVTAVGDGTDSPDKEVTVKGSASGTLGAADPPDATLTLRDDDGAPTVSLVLSSSSIAENGGVATVSAALGGASSEAVTVTVAASAVAVSGAVAGDFGLSAATTLTIAANATTSTGTVTITASDNDVDAPDKRVTVSGTAAGGNGVANPANATLTLADDEALPTTTLALAPGSIAEAGGLATVTATLSGESSAALTLTVTAAAGANAAAGDFTLSAATTLTIAAGETASAGTVTVAAVADTTDSPDKLVTVGAAAAGGNGIADPAAATLTVTDDDALPTLALTLSPSTIDESGAGSTATVSAALSHPSSEAVTVTVSAVAVAPADSGDFSVSADNTLTIAAGATTSVGAVTVAAVDDRADTPDKRVTVKGAASGGRGAANPADTTLTIADDDDAPGVTLSLSPASISESGGVSTVSAKLSRISSAATTVTVTPVGSFYTVGADADIVIAAGATTSTDTALITAVDDDVHQGGAGRTVTVTATMTNDQGTSAVTGAALTLTDDETLPTATLALSSSSVPESGGVTTVTAALSGASSEPVTVTVTAAAGAGAVSGDFAVSAAATLTIAAGETASSGTVTVTANPNTADSPDKTVTISGAADGGNGVADPAAATLTITDDDALPTVALVLDPASISEMGGVATVTAALSHPSSAAVTLTAAASAVAPAVAGDFTLSAATALTIAAGATVSTGVVTVTAVDNDVDAPDKRVTVRAAAAGGRGVADPAAVSLTLADDEETPTVTLKLSPASISEARGVSTVTATLSGESSAAVTITVSAAPASGAMLTDFSLSAARTLTIAAGATASTGRVTVTGVNDDVDRDAPKRVTISGAAAGGNGVSAPADVTLRITDNDSPPPSERQWRRSHPTPVSEGAGWEVTTQPLLGKTGPQPIGITWGTRTSIHQYAEAWACVTRTVRGPRQIRSEPYTILAPLPRPPDSSICTRLAGKGTMPTSISLTQAMIDNDGVVIVIYGAIYSNPAEGNDFYAEWVPITPLPKATLTLSPASISEAGVSTVTATLDKEAVSAATLTVSAAAISSSGAAADDFALSAAATLTFAAGTTESAGTVTIAGVDNAVDAPDKRVTVRAAAGGDVRAPPSATLTIADDDVEPMAALAVSPASVSESGGAATVTATLSHPSSAPTTITVSAAAGAGASAADFTQDGRILVVPAGRTGSSGTVTIAAHDNDADSRDKRVTVSGEAANSWDEGRGEVTEAALTIADDDATAALSLALTPASIAEDGGVSTVTATLSHPSAEAVTVTVSAAAGANAADGDFTLSAAATLTIAAGATTSAGTVTVTAADDSVDSPDKRVTVSGAAAGGLGAADPPALTLAIRDDEGAPAASLILSSSSISENGGAATLTAVLNRTASADVRLVFTATPGSNVAGYSGSANSLTIAAGRTASTGAIVVTARDDAVDQPDKRVTIGARVTSGPAASPANVVLTLVDDEPTPTLSLILSPPSISESGGAAAVTARLSGASSEAVTVTVSAAPGAGAVAADFTLSAARTLTVAAGQTTSAGAVTVTAVANAVVTPDKRVTVSGAAAGGNGAADPRPATLTLVDDDARPTASLVLSSSSIAENGGVATVTAALSEPAAEAVTVTVSAAPGAGTDFTLSAGTALTIAAGATASAGLVTVTAVDDADDGADKRVTVSGAVSGGVVADPPAATLTIRDDDGAPTLSLALTPASISENGGVATVTATLSGTQSAAVTVTVSAAAGRGTAEADFALSAARTLTIAAGAAASTGAVTIAARDDDVDSPDGTVTVSGAAAGGAAADPPAAALTIRDDDRAPGARLSVSPASISENRGVATVTATLSHPSSAATTVTVTPVSGAYTVDAGAARIVIPAGRTEPAEGSENAAAAVTAVDDGIDEPDRQVTVVGTMANAQGAAGVSGAVLTIADDDAAATVTLAASPASISENGGVTTLTATLSGPSAAAVTVTVTGVAGAWTAGPDATIVIAAGETRNASDTATVAAVDDDVYSGAAGRRVTVTGAAASGTGVHPVVGAALTLAEDEAAPTVTLAVAPGSISENGGEATVSATLSGPLAAATTVTVTPVAGAYTAGSDATIVIAAGATVDASDTATVAAVDDDLHQGSAGRSVTVTGAAASGIGAVSVTGAALTLADDGETLPTASLALTPASISESGGAATVTAALSAPSSRPVTVTVTAAPGNRAVAADFSLSAAATLTIAAGSTASAGTVTVSATATGDDAVHELDREVTVSGAAAGGNGVADPADATLAIADDEALPTVTLALTPSTISEDGGVATVTAALSHPSSEAVTVTIQAAPGDHARAADFALSAARTLTIAAGSTTSAGRVTVTAAANSANAPDKTVTVTGAAAGGNGAADPADATLTIADDDGTPRLTLSPADPAWEGHTGAARTSGGFRYANAGQLNFLVRVAPQSERPITVELADATSTFPVTSSSGRATAGADYTAFAGRTLTIPPRAAQFGFHATVLDDAVDEGKAFEAVIAELRNPVNAEIPSASAGRAAIYIREDDAAGLTVTETAGSTRTTEAGGTDTFTVALSSLPMAAVTVTLSVPAGAQDEGELSVDGGTVYGSTATLTFAPAAWSAAQTVTVRGKDDTAADGDQTWAVTLDPSSGDAVYGGLTSATLSVTNTDDDAAAGLVVVETGGSTVTAEAGGTDTFTVALARKPAADVTVVLSIPAGAQDEGELDDPEKPFLGFGSSTRTLTFKADDNTWSTAQTVAVIGKDDSVLDGHQTYAIALNPDSTDPAYRTLGNASVSVTNLDDDARASVTLTLTPSTLAEGAVATVTASLSQATGQRVTVTVSAAGASASSGDFTLSAANTLTIRHDGTESTGTVTIAAADDTADEHDETVTVSATAATAASSDPNKVTAVSSPVPVALTITDTDAAPTVTLALAPSAIDEGGVATVSATLSHPSAAPTTVTVFPAAGGAARVASDAAIVIPAGRTANASDTATIAAVDNRRDEADRSAAVTATAANGLGIGAVTGAALAIADDDNPPLLHVDSPRVTEGASGATATMTFTVRLGVASGRQVTVAWADAGTGAATAGADYATVAGGTLTFAAGETVKTVAVTVNGDDGDEPDETVVIALSAPVNATLSAARGIGTILDDDATPTLSIAAAQVTEGDGGPVTLSFPVRLSAASGATVTVDYADAGTGTADSGTDYAAIAAGTLTFLAGETSKTIAVAVTGDGADEPDETVVVRLSAPSRATLPAATATGTIADDDDPPELSISRPSAAEGDAGPATLRFTVMLSAASGRQVAVSYAEAAGGTATAGTDYTALAAGALTFAAGETSKNVDVTVAGDTLDEPNETVVVRLSGPTNATLPATAATGTGTIEDDDPPPSVSIDSPAAAVTADSGATLRFKVGLSAASSRQVTVNYAEGTGGTATRGTDYTALAAGALTFAAGETSKSLDVAVAAGASDGGTVVVTLSGPVNATLGTATGTGTISEDLAPSFTASSLSRHFGRNRAIPTFTLPAATGGNGALTYAMASLPTGLVYTAPGATDTHGGRITGTPSVNRGATVYRLTATDADGDRAALNVSITVSDAPGIQNMRIHGHQGQSLSNVTTGQRIVFTLVFDQIVRATETGIHMKLLIGDKEREATPQFGKSGDTFEVIMEYQVRADDWDGDGISLPRHPFRFSPLQFLGPNQPDGSIRLRSNLNVHAIYDIDARTQLSFTNRGDLRVNDRSPSFGSATVADKSFVDGAPVWADDPVLPAATFPTPGVGRRRRTSTRR